MSLTVSFRRVIIQIAAHTKNETRIWRQWKQLDYISECNPFVYNIDRIPRRLNMAAVVLVWCYDSLLSYFVVIFDKLRCILTQQPGLRRRRQYIAAVVAAAQPVCSFSLRQPTDDNGHMRRPTKRFPSSVSLFMDTIHIALCRYKNEEPSFN